MAPLPTLGGGLGAWHSRFVALFSSSDNNGNTGETPEPKQKKRREAETPPIPPEMPSPPPRPHPPPPSPRHRGKHPRPHSPVGGRDEICTIEGALVQFAHGVAHTIKRDAFDGRPYDNYWPDGEDHLPFDFDGVEVGPDYIIIPAGMVAYIKQPGPDFMAIVFSPGTPTTYDREKKFYLEFKTFAALAPETRTRISPVIKDQLLIIPNQTIRFSKPLVFPVVGPE